MKTHHCRSGGLAPQLSWSKGFPMILFASDLDNTLIHSYKKAAENDICVETMQTDTGIKKLSYMTPKGYQLFKNIYSSKSVAFVPITTRSLSQYRRIHLFDEAVPKYALAANGGILLIDGKQDDEWYAQSEKLIKPALSVLAKGAELLEQDKSRTFEVRLVDGMFVFTKSDNAEETCRLLRERLDMGLVSVHTNGNKVYILPIQLNKSTAVKRLAEKYKFSSIICAGDSEFDIPMLREADISFVPHEKLIDSCKGEINVYTDTDVSFAEYFLSKMIMNLH